MRDADVSRAVSHMLRHEPWLYELELDEQGWTAVDDVLAALRGRRGDWASLQRPDLERMIAGSAKQRFEMVGDRIRALYGHSLPGRLVRTPAAPPPVLYHGTSPASLPAIRAAGLRPMRRQYVHLSLDRATALDVGRRKADRPVLLTVRAGDAAGEGVAFYRGNAQVWLADAVPARFLGEPG